LSQSSGVLTDKGFPTFCLKSEFGPWLVSLRNGWKLEKVAREDDPYFSLMIRDRDDIPGYRQMVACFPAHFAQ
jgi:hypothetical protein